MNRLAFFILLFIFVPLLSGERANPNYQTVAGSGATGTFQQRQLRRRRRAGDFGVC
jgi:hypothetical protein